MSFPWNGSKRWLLSFIEDELECFSPTRYLEPFAGSGNVSRRVRALWPEVPQVIGDANPWLGSFYERQVSDTRSYELPSKVCDYVYWRSLRDSDLSSLTLHERVLRFAVCLTTAWGNRWKTEIEGHFTNSSTPVNVKFTGEEYIRERVQLILKDEWLQPGRDQVLIGDWSTVVKRASPGDLVFLDPPYPETLGYGNQTWTISNMLDVIDWITEATSTGIHVIATNVGDVERLYRRAGLRTRLIPCPTKSNTRRARVELLASSSRETGGLVELFRK